MYGAGFYDHVYHVCLYSNSDIVASGSDHRLLATVTFEYSSQQEGELSLSVGDVINDVTEVTSRARGVILYTCVANVSLVAEMDSYMMSGIWMISLWAIQALYVGPGWCMIHLSDAGINISPVLKKIHPLVKWGPDDVVPISVVI